jgi:hypothetical protein
MFEEKIDAYKPERRTSKGYRLKSSTHSLIKSLQVLTQKDVETVISESCLLLYKKIISEKEKNSSIIKISPKEGI